MKQGSARVYHWGIEKASSDKAPLWLALLFGLEIALFIPLDAVMMFFCLHKRSNIFLYIMIATIASTISGVIGYLFGHFLWDLISHWVVPHLISAGAFAKMSVHLQQYENWAVFFGALIPFPLKALSLVSGVFDLGLGSFITFFALARLIRFSIIGASMLMWGEKVKAFIDRHFHRIFMLVGAKTAVALFFFWVLAR